MCGYFVFRYSPAAVASEDPRGARNLRTVPGFPALREKGVCVVACEIRDTLHVERCAERLREEPS